MNKSLYSPLNEKEPEDRGNRDSQFNTITNPSVPGSQNVVHFQHSLGNIATLRMHGYGERIQRKSLPETNNDPYEQEADAFANHLTEESEPSMELSSVSTSVQRSSTDAPQSTAAVSATSTDDPATASETTPTPGLIVEDSATELTTGQMRKSEFLSQLRAAVTETTESALSGTIWSISGSTWIDYYFQQYNNQTGEQIERAICRNVPETTGVTSAREYIPPICSKVRQGIEAWIGNNGNPQSENSGILSSITGIGSSIVRGAGNVLSGIGALLFKSRDGNSKKDTDPVAVRSQLSTGKPLDSGIRTQMESALGYDFSSVKIHTDANDAKLSHDLNARAFTVGSDIAFDTGEYRPGTLVGDALIAHELAHVVQQGGGSHSMSPMQKGDSNNGSLEEDADLSALQSVASIWGGGQRNSDTISKSALPRLKSGLKLQRCTCTCTRTSSGPINQDRLDVAYNNFNRNHKGTLTDTEIVKIHESLNLILADNFNLWIAFYDYYSSHEIRKATTEELSEWDENNSDTTGETSESGNNNSGTTEGSSGSDEENAQTLAVTTGGGDSVYRPSVFEFPNSQLGPLLVHEYSHTRNPTNWMGSSDYLEGGAYAIEYFYARKAGNRDRCDSILEIVRNPQQLAANQSAAIRELWYMTLGTLYALYDIIQGRKLPPALNNSPFKRNPKPFTSDEAQAFVTELIANAQTRHRSETLNQMTAWMLQNHGSTSYSIPNIGSI